MNCSYNKLTSLNVSTNTALTTLNFSNNYSLSTLDLSHNTALQSLYCEACSHLSTLDLSHNTALTTLYCYNNQLTALDLSHNTALTTLYCYNNQLTALDLSHNTALKDLRCYKNQLTSLDLSANTALIRIYCQENQLTSLNLRNNTALTTLSCYNNQLTSLLFNTNATALTYISCYNNRLREQAMGNLVNSLPTVTSGDFYVVHHSSETEQNVISYAQVNSATAKGWTAKDSYDYNYYGYDSPFIAINEINFPDDNFRRYLLQQSYGSDQLLTSDEIANILSIQVPNREISDLKGIEYFTALKTLYCAHNSLETLDLSANTALQTLAMNGNQITSLDLSANTALTTVYCYESGLTELILPSSETLTYLSCYGNQLTTLDLTGQRNLTTIICYSNNIGFETMQEVVESLPTVDAQVAHYFYVINTSDEGEGNVIMQEQVAIATAKNWIVVDKNRNPVEGFVVGEAEAYAALSSDGKTLTFYYDGLKDARHGTKYPIPWTGNYPGWTSSAGDATIETVNFDESFADYHGLTQTQYMFYKMTALKNVNHTDYLDARNVTMTSWMFDGCTSLTSLDMRCFDTGKLSRLLYMFRNCSNLATIYANTDWKTSSNTSNSTRMFYGCTKLKNYSSTNVENNWNVTRANPSGYFTYKIDAYAVLDNGTLTFCYDSRRMSRTGTTYSIPWNGDYPRWTGADGNADVTTVDFESSFARAPKLTSTNKMFYKLSNLTTVNNLNYLNTENVTNMSEMFSGCSALTTIYCNDDWNTSALTNSTDMFKDCTHLVGGNGTAYNASIVDATYARPDVAWESGYFTYKFVIGDVNGDGQVTIADVTALVNIILGKSEAPASGVADVNTDGSITIADVTALVNIILGKTNQ